MPLGTYGPFSSNVYDPTEEFRAVPEQTAVGALQDLIDDLEQFESDYSDDLAADIQSLAKSLPLERGRLPLSTVNEWETSGGQAEREAAKAIRRRV